MRVQIAVDVKVAQRNHELSGITSWLTAELLAFSLRGRALQRGPAKLKLDLLGTGRVIDVGVRILTIELGGTSGRNQYTARITDISRGDRARLDAWVDERSRPAGSRSASRSVATQGGRGALGDAMKTGLDRAREPTAAQVLPEPVAPPEPEEELVLAPSVKLAGDGSSMSVAWSNWTSVTSSWEESLSEGHLRVHLEERHPPRGYSLIVQLCLPDGSVHAALGRVSLTEPPSLFLSLTLKDSVKRALSGK